MPIQLSVVGMALAALLTAAVVSLIATPVVKSLAFRVGAVDIPKDGRRMHDHPIPRMGGLAIFFGFMLSVLLFVPLTEQLRGMLLGGVIIVILGISSPTLIFSVASLTGSWDGCLSPSLYCGSWASQTPSI